MRHRFLVINLYMGKLRFTLTNIIFWIVLMLSCFLSENFAVLTNDPLKGFSLDSAFILTGAVIILLGLYYFLEHKKNKLTFDKILLPAISIIGLTLILNIFRQDSRTFTDYFGTGTLTFVFPIEGRIFAILEVVVWLSILYALVFVYNRFRLNKESYRWIAKVYLIAVIALVAIDVVIEADTIVEILRGTHSDGGLEFLMGNANVWSLLIFSGILSAIILSHKHFKWFYYVTMMALWTYNLLTICTTTILLSGLALFAYTVYEILSYFRENKKVALKHLLIYLGCCFSIVLVVGILTLIRVPMFVNLWKFVDRTFGAKDTSTFGVRINIWNRVFGLVSTNTLDFLFGLGHHIGPSIFKEYMKDYFPVKSAHNAFMEMFLRYGLFGALVYLGIIGVTIYSLILHFKKKNYRFAFIYGICFLAILGHSITESTTLFTPNVGGLYFSFVFVLPIINIIQEKRFKELKEDVINAPSVKEKVSRSFYLNLFIVAALSAVVTRFIKQVLRLDLFSSILVILGFIILYLIVLSLLRKNKEYNPVRAFANNSFAYYQNLIRKENNNER